MASAPFSHVIFDLDGTLLNTLDDLAAAGNHVCELHGWPTFPTDRYRYKVGNGMPKLVERFMPAEYAGDARMFELAFAEFRSYYNEHKCDATAPYPGIIEMLDELRASGITCAVLTNKARPRWSRGSLGPIGLNSYRDASMRSRPSRRPPSPSMCSSGSGPTPRKRSMWATQTSTCSAVTTRGWRWPAALGVFAARGSLLPRARSLSPTSRPTSSALRSAGKRSLQTNAPPHSAMGHSDLH